MSPTLPNNRILYLLAAFVLLMQSFAIWHNAEHQFHANTDQCQRLEAFSHAPMLDIVTLPTLLFSSLYLLIKAVPSKQLLPGQQRKAYAIRAPPHFS